MRASILLLGAAICFAQEAGQGQLAHFHHVHLNVTDPAAAIVFYTSTFDCEKASFAGTQDAVRAQKSWLLFTKVATPPKSEVTSAIWHIGWCAEDMQATYRKQLDMGTPFETPLTDISDLVGSNSPASSCTPTSMARIISSSSSTPPIIIILGTSTC
jgi:catechol 2,3-dioxygenase-like lactoylglutathione lyase family enzyme